MADISDLNNKNIFTDLIKQFQINNHKIFLVSPIQSKETRQNILITDSNITIFRPFIGRFSKTNLALKFINSLFFEYRILTFLKSNLNDKIDLIVYSTPPINYTKIIDWFKKKHGSKTYLLLKDIFPQNAVDLKLIKYNSFIHKYYRKKESLLYEISDFIGCMSKKNCDYILEHNKIPINKVHINPNSIDPFIYNPNSSDKTLFFSKFNIPLNKTYIVYGGNFGLPQGIEFLLKVIFKLKDSKALHFVLIGSGTKWNLVKMWNNRYNLTNVTLIENLSSFEFNKLIHYFHVGIILLNSSFTIPNYPSRLLAYLNAKLPIIAATDSVTDVKDLILNNNLGFWSLHGNVDLFLSNIYKLMVHETRKKMSFNAYNVLIRDFNVFLSYNIIIDKFNGC